MTPEASIALIKANLAEVLHPEIIDDVVLEEKRPLRVYWGTATTGKPYVGRSLIDASRGISFTNRMIMIDTAATSFQ
jgi:tyrosyl-tRNA synthetase